MAGRHSDQDDKCESTSVAAAAAGTGIHIPGYHDRNHECDTTMSEIRQHPMTTYDTVVHVLKRMWDCETGADDGSRPVGSEKAWQELRAHLEHMVDQARRRLPKPPELSPRREWILEREAAAGAQGKEEEKKKYGVVHVPCDIGLPVRGAQGKEKKYVAEAAFAHLSDWLARDARGKEKKGRKEAEAA